MRYSVLAILGLLCLACLISSITSAEPLSGDDVSAVDTDAPKKGKRGGKKSGGKGKKRQSGRKSFFAKQRVATEAWTASLNPEKDYNGSAWRSMFHSRSASDFFDRYLQRLSAIFRENDATVNFALVGACDGITDPTIKYRFFKYDHWQAVFVEPMTINVRDLKKFLEDNGALNRSHIIQAAATDKCEHPTISVERPLYEEKNNSAKIPHWLRRQIGSIVPKHRNHARPEWTLEEVPCLTASDVLTEWATATLPMSKNRKAKGKQQKRRRPHVLKIDVEGHDYEVLMGFISPETPTSELPLLIEFEAKSIGKKFPAAKANLEARGYVVTPFGADGFALLKGDSALPKGGGRKKAASSAANEDGSVVLTEVAEVEE